MQNFGNVYICGSPFVMTRTDAQNGVYSVFNQVEELEGMERDQLGRQNEHNKFRTRTQMVREHTSGGSEDMLQRRNFEFLGYPKQHLSHFHASFGGNYYPQKINFSLFKVAQHLPTFLQGFELFPIIPLVHPLHKCHMCLLITRS